jgi:hypothetical protein
MAQCSPIQNNNKGQKKNQKLKKMYTGKYKKKNKINVHVYIHTEKLFFINDVL